ncbi:exodeoxyribonuclease iii xth [Penicillium taxi]|uniref:exodeoxyribonuclease iii xth n=1 Tax=Penicillium taxi TaxID=168475 RepID=UPI0025455A64|nr:exodeoxyribonuclease iii xth [Penicillium taxi]KAJ5901786.1 exodeoxyribonuclease iii xth [Penicillium taxi]
MGPPKEPPRPLLPEASTASSALSTSSNATSYASTEHSQSFEADAEADIIMTGIKSPIPTISTLPSAAVPPRLFSEASTASNASNASKLPPPVFGTPPRTAGSYQFLFSEASASSSSIIAASHASTEHSPLDEAYTHTDLMAILELRNIFDESVEPLSKLLSISSVASTNSSFAETQQLAQGTEQLFRLIGAGTCGKVFSRDGSTDVYKLAIDDSDELWNDYGMHTKVLEAFARHPSMVSEVHVPQVDFFISMAHGGDISAEWWQTHGPLFPPDTANVPNNVLKSERILPLPSKIRACLIRHYCHHSLREAAWRSPGNKDCLVRLYLGKRRDISRRPPRMFNLRNYNMHLDQMEELKLDTSTYAKYMGRALAIMYWEAGIDGNDVEFVLGSAPTYSVSSPLTSTEIADLPKNSTTVPLVRKIYDFRKRFVYLWILDFNKCRTITMDEVGVKQAVRAFYRNDPYFPRPLTKKASDQLLWDELRDAYLSASKVCLKGKPALQKLPDLFIEEAIKEQKLRIARKLRAELSLADSSFEKTQV